MKRPLTVQELAKIDELLTVIPCQYTRMAMMGIIRNDPDKVFDAMEQIEQNLWTTNSMKIVRELIYSVFAYEKPNQTFWGSVIRWIRHNEYETKVDKPFPDYPPHLLPKEIDPNKQYYFNYYSGRITTKEQR